MIKKIKNTKEAKFFCESCGNEVPRKSKFCPSCGKFFASVRCPKCGRCGTNDDFKNGCPDCGYAVTQDTLQSHNQTNINFTSGNLDKNTSKKFYSNIFTSNKKNKHSYSDSSLPIWVYAITIFVLIILVIFLYSCL